MATMKVSLLGVIIVIGFLFAAYFPPYWQVNINQVVTAC